MKNIEHELDALVQQWANRQPSFISGKMGCVGHHIISRKNKLLRWDLRNIMPLTLQEHTLIHSNAEAHQIAYECIDADTMKYLNELANTYYRTWLMFEGLTEEEFFKRERKKLRDALVDKYLYKSCKKC